MPSTSTQTACPTADKLRQFVADRLPETEIDRIERHLELCADCERIVGDLERQGFVPPNQATHNSVTPSQESLIDRLAAPEQIERLPFPKFSVPERIDKYEILEVLGSGGMGTVFKARHAHLKRDVAIKLIKSSRRFDAHAVARFSQEIEAIGKLDHANIVRAHDAGVDDNGQPYLVMELLSGRDVETLIKRRGPLSTEEACKLIRQAATALHQVHQAGLVHRDVKPSNLFVTTAGIVKLLDLGLVRLYDDDPPEVSSDMPTDDGSIDETGDGRTTGVLTSKLAVLGSPLFMAPEQIEQSHRVDHRADIYSLGCTFYFLLTGETPYRGTRTEILAAHLEGAFPPVQSRRLDVPVTLQRLIGMMTMRNVNHRLSTAREAVDVLTKLREAEKPKPPVLH